MISQGRVVLGVGIGSLREEFDLLGKDWASRGRVTDEAIDAIRTSFGTATPEFAGTYFSYDGLVVAPAGLPRRLDIWVGGHSDVSLTRALTRGTGWMPFGIPPAGISAMLAQHELPEGFEVVLSSLPLDPAGDPTRTSRALGRLAEAGATVVSAPVRASSATHYCEQLHALADLSRDLVPSVVGEEIQQ